MDKFIHLPQEEQSIVFQEAANRRGVLPIIIEKKTSGFVGYSNVFLKTRNYLRN